MATDNNRIVVDTLNNLFSQNQQKNQKKQNFKRAKGVTDKDLEVALTVILVDLASSDQNFEPQEYTVIQKGLARMFGTNKTEVSPLVNQAKIILGNMRGTGSSLKILKENLDLEQRQTVMEIIDEVIDTDGVEDGFEVYLRTKFLDGLGLKEESE